MPPVIQIKRRTSGTGNASITLAEGELYYNEFDKILYIGTSAGTTTFHFLGGEGTHVSLRSISQTIAGTKTFSGSILVPNQSANNNSTNAANTAYVDAAVNAAAGTGAVANSQLANMAQATIKGRAAAAGTGAPSDLSASQVKTILAVVAADIGDFNTAVRTNRLDQMAVPTASVDANSQRIINLGAPVNPNDAARKADVDASAAGLDFKQSVRAVSISNIASLSGTTTIDGVSVSAGDRVLLTGQSTAHQNGLWLISASAWTRPTDWTGATTASGGAFVFVEQGTTYSDTGWVCTTNGSITVGTDASAWTQFSSNALPGGSPLQIQYGGTGLTSVASGALLYGPSSGQSMTALTVGAAGTILTMNSGGTAPQWSNVIDGGAF